jgi:hypothetical protein
MDNTLKDENDYSWTVHLAHQNKWRAIFGGIIILLISWIIYYEFDKLYWSIFSIFILFFSLRQFYFPIHFTINSVGISRKSFLGKSSIKWEDIKRFIKNDNGGILYSRRTKSIADLFTGLELQFNQYSDDIINQIELKMTDST